MADRVVVLSEEWRDYFAENVCDPNKITVVHNGVACRRSRVRLVRIKTSYF